MKEEKPLLSIVTCSRNDNHGNDLLQRCSLFVKGLLLKCRKNNFKAELIMVEWNPPAGKSLLKDVLPLPEESDWLDIRFVVVPKELHDTIPCAANISLHQMIAKNVGIRRARAPFVLSTNNDLLFTEELFVFLAKQELREGVVYRANRCDVPREMDYTLSVSEQLDFCKKNIIERRGKHYLYPEIIEAASKINEFPPASWLLCQLSRFRQHFFPRPSDMFITLDTEACGDFTLMSKKDWLDVGGHFEVGAYPAHLDMLVLIAAWLRGKQQIILPLDCCSYHITHEDGWDFDDPVRNLYKDISRPRLDWRTVKHLATVFAKDKKTLDLNGEDWGYPNHDFKEYVFCGGK